MASSNASCRFLRVPRFRLRRRFGVVNPVLLKQGIKTGLAGTITYAIYAGLELAQGYWAGLRGPGGHAGQRRRNPGKRRSTALSVPQRALAAALLLPILGTAPCAPGSLCLSLLLFRLSRGSASEFLARPDSPRIDFGLRRHREPWHVPGCACSNTLLGALVAFAVSSLIWPVHARVGLRNKMANLLQGAGALYSAVVAAALEA